jgi:hypothetical protein
MKVISKLTPLVSARHPVIVELEVACQTQFKYRKVNVMRKDKNLFSKCETYMVTTLKRWFVPVGNLKPLDQSSLIPSILHFVVAIAALTAANSAFASNILAVTVAPMDIPFLLDSDGQVWAFKKPLTFEKPIRLPNLNHIKKIAPYIAVDAEGHVLTWSLKDLKMDESGITEVTYSDPQKVGSLRGVTSVAYSGNHFVAVIENKDIVDWEEIHEAQTYRVKGYGLIRTVISQNGVKAVAATSWPRVISRTGTVLEEASESLVALFDDGTVLGWGFASTGRSTRDSNWQSILLTKSPGAISVALNRSHTVVLSSKGVPQFWGDCGVDKSISKDPAGFPWPSGSVIGADGYVVDVIGMALAEGNDNVLSNVFIKRDGSVWAAHAPVPPDMTTPYCQRPAGYEHSWKLSEGSVIAVQVASGGATILMLDTEHNLWRTSDNYLKQKFSKINFIPK